MAKTISNLLVGVGFDLDKDSTKKVSSGIDSVKSKALQLGGIVAGAFGIKALTSDFAEAKDDLGKFSEVMGVSANNINAFGSALRLEGGTLNSFMAQLAGIEKFRAGFKVGDIGFLPAAEKAGIDTKTILNAKDAGEAYLSLADQFQRLSKQQRINAAQAIGLDEASIRLLSRGRKAVEAVVAKEKERREITEAMLKTSARFNDETQKLGDSIGGIADQISVRTLPHINNLLSGMSDWIVANRTIIDSGIDTFFNTLGKSPAPPALPATPPTLDTKPPAFATPPNPSLLPTAETALPAAPKPPAGDIINKSLSDEIGSEIGRTITSILAKFGVSEAKQTLKLMQRPIVIQSNLTMDGKVIDKKVQKVVGGMADQAIQDLSSSEGG